MDALPMELLALLAVAGDDAKPRDARAGAVRALERRTRKEHRRGVARELVPLLHAPPDIAGAVHLALLVLDPDVAVGLVDGRFAASDTPWSACDDDGVARAAKDVGRVVALDA